MKSAALCSLLGSLAAVSCGGDGECEPVQYGICDISAPTEVVAGEPLVVNLRYEYAGHGGNNITFQQDGNRFVLKASQCRCCRDCPCEVRLVTGELRIPTLAAGMYRLEVGLASKACSGKTSVDVTVR